MAKITGIGGVFFKARDPKALAAWYREVLGFDVQDWGGVQFRAPAGESPPFAVWSPFAADTEYFAPSAKAYMINFAVDDMDAFLAQIEKKGAKVLKRDDSDPSGRFAWVMDPDENKIELWQPKLE